MTFEMPEKAKRELSRREEAAGFRVIEWDGTEARWEPEDIALAETIKRQLIRGEITGEEAKNQISVIHEIKQLGGFQISQREPEQEALPLSDPDQNTPGKMHSDPQATEKAAAYKVYPRTGSQRRLILDAIAQSEGGLIDEEIGALPGVADTAHRTRRNELVMGGWVEDSGKVRFTASGTESIVWVLTDEGRARL